MVIKTTRWLQRAINKKMKLKWRVPTSVEIIWPYMLFNGIRRDENKMEEYVDHPDGDKDPVEDFEMTRFFVQIDKYIKWYTYTNNVQTREKVKMLLDNRAWNEKITWFLSK